MKRKEVPDEVKQKERIQLELANKSHWTVEAGPASRPKLRFGQAGPALSRACRFNVEYDMGASSQSKAQLDSARQTFAPKSAK